MTALIISLIILLTMPLTVVLSIPLTTLLTSGEVGSFGNARQMGLSSTAAAPTPIRQRCLIGVGAAAGTPRRR